MSRHPFERDPVRYTTWRVLGAGLFVGLVAAFSGYAITGHTAWFVAPLLGLAFAGWLRRNS